MADSLYGELIKLAAEMALRQNMPSVDGWRWSSRHSKRIKYDATKACAVADTQCAVWALELRRIADRLAALPKQEWKTMDETPQHNPRADSLGTEYIIHPPYDGRSTAFYGRRLGGNSCWYYAGARVHGVTHWRPLPPPPTVDEREK